MRAGYRCWTKEETDHLEALRLDGLTIREIVARWPARWPRRPFRSVQMTLHRHELRRVRLERSPASVAWLLSDHPLALIVAATGLKLATVKKWRWLLRRAGHAIKEQRTRHY